MKPGGYIYILASQKMGTLYIGSTSDVTMRMAQHRHEFFKGFTQKYGVKMLVYYEYHKSLENMVKRERQMKEWKRNWKLSRIIEFNSDWHDLYDEFANEVIDLISERYPAA